jgi:hypothetical protein
MALLLSRSIILYGPGTPVVASIFLVTRLLSLVLYSFVMPLYGKRPLVRQINRGVSGVGKELVECNTRGH